jgi:ribonuclease VapC
MFVDASAIVAILAGEEDAALLVERLSNGTARTSPVAVYEAVLGLARARNLAIADAETAVDQLLAAARIDIVAITEEIGRAALRAFDRFGRGRHPAALNLGDCFAYACASTLDAPLLFKGKDFAQTDIMAG